MARPKLKGLWSPDLPMGEESLPNDPSNCWIVIQADIGLPDSDAADTFTFYVCTLKFLDHALKQEGFLLAAHTIVVSQFDWQTVRIAIEAACDRATGNSWKDITSRLSQFADHE